MTEEASWHRPGIFGVVVRRTQVSPPGALAPALIWVEESPSGGLDGGGSAAQLQSCIDNPDVWVADDVRLLRGPGGAVAARGRTGGFLHPLAEFPCPRRVFSRVDGALPELPTELLAWRARAAVKPPRQQRPMRICGRIAAIAAPRVIHRPH